MLAKDVLTEEWLAEVLQDSLDMDWTSTDGARAIMRALENGLVKLPQSGGQILSTLSADAIRQGEGRAIADVAAERARQMSVEGWSPNHDDQHTDRSLATAAACYTMFAAATDEARNTTDLPGSLASLGKPIRGWAAFLQIWPWDRRWWKPKSRRADLVRAGALIIAEIERLDRREAARG